MVPAVKNGQHELEFVVTAPWGLKWHESMIGMLMDRENGRVVCIFPAMWVSDDP